MRFQVLGPVTAHGERGPVDLGSARQRTVLAVLLVDPGSRMPVDQLVDRVWGPAPPPHARRTVQTYLSRLRSILSGAEGPVLAKGAASYSLAADQSAVDMHRFRALVTNARKTTDDQAAALWQEALALWRGVPFTELASDWLQAVAVGLEAERWSATLDYFDVQLRRGEHAPLLPELSTAASDRPLDERLAGQLMLALYRCGRQSEALATYRCLHERLVDELGCDPGPDLHEMHQRILRQDPELACVKPAVPPALPAVATLTRPRPAQLPADVVDFTGRAAELAQLDAFAWRGAGDQAAGAVVITAISGTAGVGKTALAVHWAHRVADRFPDGQLYVNLRGYDPERPVDPADALARLLTALGVQGLDIPVEVDDRAARFRSELAGRQMLIVLDNAASVAQVRPLLPGSGSCVVVVTSRDSLAGLVTVQGARRITLGLLPPADAVDVLRGLIGARVDAEPEATATLAEQCARLPLALRIAAELAAARPENTVASLVAELSDRQARLAHLDAGGDPYATVREVFFWSIQQLPAAAVRLFRLLGLHPGPDLEVSAAAALAGSNPAEVRQDLAVLVRAHLVHRVGAGRYGMHDLLRAYAAELATAADHAPAGDAALARLLDFYQAAAVAAMDTLYPAESHDRPEVPDCAVAIPDLGVRAAARDWLATELPCLVAVVAHAADHGRAGYAVGLARILYRYLVDGHPHEAVTLNSHALRAADQVGDLAGQAQALRALGMAHYRLARFELAHDHYKQALTRFQQAGDPVGEALTLTARGIAHYRQGSHKQAIEDQCTGLELARHAGDQLAEAFVLNNLAVVKDRLGQLADSAEHYRQALGILTQRGATFNEGIALNNLANVELRQGLYLAAADHLRQALDILNQFDSPVMQATVRDSLGLLHLHLNEPRKATEHFQEALDRFRQVGDGNGQAWSLNGLGDAALLTGRCGDAQAHHTEALTLATETGTRHQLARAHAGLGHVHRDRGEVDQARTHYELAHATYVELHMPEAAQVHAELSRLGPAGDGRSGAPDDR